MAEGVDEVTKPQSAGDSEADEVRKELQSYLNKRMRIGISDGRVIDGLFLCTDRDCNIVLGNCEEFLSQDEVGMLDRQPLWLWVHLSLCNR